MHRYSQHLKQLAARVSRGDFAARAQFREEMESQLAHLVRVTLRQPRSKDDHTSQFLRAQADQLLAEDGLALVENPERFAHDVAVRVCDTMIARLWPGPIAENTRGDTVCTAARADTHLVA